MTIARLLLAMIPVAIMAMMARSGFFEPRFIFQFYKSILEFISLFFFGHEVPSFPPLLCVAIIVTMIIFVLSALITFVVCGFVRVWRSCGPKRMSEKTYRVFMSQVNRQMIEVKASSEEEAREKARRKWQQEYARSHIEEVEQQTLDRSLYAETHKVESPNSVNLVKDLLERKAY